MSQTECFLISVKHFSAHAHIDAIKSVAMAVSCCVKLTVYDKPAIMVLAVLNGDKNTIESVSNSLVESYENFG